MKTLKSITTMIILILFAHHLVVFLHEYGHSFLAWTLGDKSNPFDITYGGTGLGNILLLSNIEENVDYSFIFSQGHPLHVAWIAAAGPFLAGGICYEISRRLLERGGKSFHPLFYQFVFWIHFASLANFYDYVPIRVFVDHGDMGHLAAGLGLPHWLILIVFGCPVFYLIYRFFHRTLPEAFVRLDFSTEREQRILLITCVFILFGYYGLAGIRGYGEICSFFSKMSLLSIPVVLTVYWPSREWVKKRITEVIKGGVA